MDFDDRIRRKIRMDMPKLLLYDGVEYGRLLDGYNKSVHSSAKSFLSTLDINLTFGDVDELILRNNMTTRMITFFMNYMQNENLVRGEELAKKLYLGILEVKLYDADGNLEYDMMSEATAMLTFPTYSESIFNEIILLCRDLNRWFAVYINKQTRVGQYLDFKNEGKVEVYQNLEVLNEIIKEEFHFEILDFDIRVLSDNVNINTDGAFFIINLFYKLVNGTPLLSLTFTPKEKDILISRLVWLLLKTQSIDQMKQSAIQAAKQSAAIKSSSSNKNKFDHVNVLEEISSKSNITDDIILDQSVQKNGPARRQDKKNTLHQNQRSTYYHDDDNDDDIDLDNYDDEKYDSVSQAMPYSTYIRSTKNQKGTSNIFQKKRNQTKLLSIGGRSSQQDSSRNIDLMESFDLRNESSQNRINTSKSNNLLNSSRVQVSYQESTGDDLESMWNIGNSMVQQPIKMKKTTQMKIDPVQDQLNKMWDFKTNYKRGMRNGQVANLPVLIPEELKPYYKERNNQTSMQRDIQDKIIDVLAFLEGGNGNNINGQNPTLVYAVNRLKQKLGTSLSDGGGDNNKKNHEADDDNKIKMKNLNEMKALIKAKMMAEATGDLDQMLQRQQILDDILEEGSQDRGVLEKRFENEIKKIDLRFQEYIQKYDSLNTFQNLQQQFAKGGSQTIGPQVNEIVQMKESMHLQLHNYLLGGLGLPTKYSNNPNFTAQPSSPGELAPIPGFNRRSVEKLPPNSQSNFVRNQSMINLNRQSGKNQISPLISPDSSQRSGSSRGSSSSNNEQEQDLITKRYNVRISQKQLIDLLTNDSVSQNIVSFILGYLEERHFQTTKRDVMIRDQRRIYLYPIEFYGILAGNSPMVKQQQLNLSGVEKFTFKYSGKHTIFDEFDKLIFPVLLEKPQHYALVVADLNVRQLIYFPIHSSTSKETNKAVSGNILKYLEREYSNKLMKNLKILDWIIDDIPCSQTSDASLSPYYLILFISMIYDSQFKFKQADVLRIKTVKIWIPDVFKSVGITQNKPAELQIFIPPPS